MFLIRSRHKNLHIDDKKKDKRESSKNTNKWLYFFSSLKKVSVAAMGGWLDGVWIWGDFGVSESLLTNPVIVEELGNLRWRLEDFRGWNSEKDKVSWTGNPENSFSVASWYSFYDSIRLPFAPPNIHEGVFGLILKLEVPFNIKAFGWRLFLNRLPTKDLLEIRGMHLPLKNLICTF